MAKLFCILILIGICFLESEAQNSGPVGKVKIEYFTKCSTFKDVEGYAYNGILRGKDNSKVLDFDFKLDHEVNAETKYQVYVDKWNNGVWQEDIYDSDGPFFETLNKFLPKMFQNFKDKVTPAITGDIIPPGEYKMDGFEDVESSIEFPQIFYGKFRVTFYLIEQDEEVVCVEFGMDSQPKQKGK